jgi:hypothetical protein
VSFPFDLHNAAVFDSHIPCRSHAVPRICRYESDVSRPLQGRGWGTGGDLSVNLGRPETACWRPARVRLLPATTRISRQFVISSIPISDAVASVKQSGVCDGRGEDYCVGART